MASGLMVAGLVMAGGAQIAGAIQQGQGAVAAAQTAIDTGNYNYGVSQYNKTIALQNADTARKLAQNRATGELQAGALHLGSARTQMAANGVDILEADTSPVLALEQIAADYAASAELELYSGEVEARGYEREAKLYQSQGDYALWEGNQKANAYLASAPTVLGTVLKVGGTVASGFGYMKHEGMI